MPASTVTAAYALALLACACASSIDLSLCETAVRTESGWVCGLLRRDSAGGEYASFRGIPYAKQPLGELRFQELQPPEPWEGVLNASAEGPVCPQTDVFYGRVARPQGMAEACIHANVHVPASAVPGAGHDARLPILVFVHGGGFMFGSGDADLHGPEYLVTKRVIVVTFNYRLNVFGFLSLNSTSIPGNNGLKDVMTLLRWVRRNARAFGGDPNGITLAGQSAGAVMTHLLTLTPSAHGLFQKAIILSGTAFTEFVSSSQQFAKSLANMFLAKVGIDPQLDAEEVHRLLIDTPLDTIMEANRHLINFFGLMGFTPVIETQFPGVTTIMDVHPEVLVDAGQGRHVPLLIGFTDEECQSFRPRLEQINIAAKIQALPIVSVPSNLIYRLPESNLPVLTKLIHNRYFNETVDVDNFANLCTDAYYKYPALKLASKRIGSSAPTFLYRFAYGGRHSALKEAWGLEFPGAGHVEDIMYFFRVNSVLGPVVDNELTKTDDDTKMKHRMMDFIVNFMRHSHPIPGPHGHSRWPPVERPLLYQNIAGPNHIQLSRPTADEVELTDFFNSLYTMSPGE